MLVTVAQIQAIPGLSNACILPLPYLNSLIGAATKAIQTYCKQNLELRAYTEYQDGATKTDIICRQFPVLSGVTTITSSSNGVALPTGTINVTSTNGFNPGVGGDPNAERPVIAVQTAINTSAVVSYTGSTATTFTGCEGGSGTMSSAQYYNQVNSPVVFLDSNGMYGQSLSGFGPTTQLVQGNDYAVVLDEDRTSRRGLIRRVGGAGGGFWGGFWNANAYTGKLAGSRLPCWPFGEGNIKVQYSAGFRQDAIPFDLQYACAMLVAQMVRIQPTGANLSGENLGNYSYTTLVNSEDPEIGEVRRTLASYREVSFGI